MHSVVFQKKLNNAELGKGGVHETYIREDSDFNFDEFKFVKSEVMTFWCPSNQKEYKGLHYEKFPNESRIAGLGEFFRDFSVTASDTVILTANINKDLREYFIDVKKENNILVVLENKNGLEILNEDKISLINENTTFNNLPFSVVLLKQAKKRSDSPILTNYYTINVNNEPYPPQMGKWFEIKIDNNNAILRPRKIWTKNIFTIGD